MKRLSLLYLVVVSVVLTALFPALNFAQTSISNGSMPATKIINDFNSSGFLQNVDSQQVVNDLRNGQWTTTVTDPNTNVTTTTTQALPTGKMGWGETEISLALAQQSLTQQGITQPTSDQLYTALAGDPTTGTTGILQMRADGMGWGQIAQQYDVKLGQLMGAIKSGKQIGPATATGTTSDGITSASGKASNGGNANVTGKANGKAYGSNSQGNGIVNASGQSTGGYYSSASQGGNGIVSGSGRSMGASGIVTGAGGGNQYGVSGGAHGNGGGMGNGHGR